MEKRAQGMSLQQRKDDLPEILRRFEQENMQKVAAEKNRCHFHLMAPVGWLNDPNGLSYFGDRYHVFFQYSPFAVNGGMKLWGHYTSKDLVQYKYEGAPFLPDETYDKDGVFSGSAIVWKDKMYLFYTGNVEEEGDHDYIHSGRGANVIRVISEDGEHFSAKQCILTNADYPAECTNQVRDPKLFQMADGTFRMVLGAWLQDDKGAVLLYSSTDLEHFTFEQLYTTEKAFGYMWECPDIFALDGHRILAVCPQGVPSEAEQYQNIYQSGYFIETEETRTVDASFKGTEETRTVNASFKGTEETRTVDASFKGTKETRNVNPSFIEWDMGFDFYAPQTFETPVGRRILIGWAGVPDAEYSSNPMNEGWQHSLTVPRELRYHNGKIYQLPIRELGQLRKKEILPEKESYVLDNGCGELIFDGIAGSSLAAICVQIGTGCSLFYEKGLVTLQFTDDSGAGRGKRVARCEAVHKIQILMDVSILEIYINDGEIVMTSRIFFSGKDATVRFLGQAEMIQAWQL